MMKIKSTLIALVFLFSALSASYAQQVAEIQQSLVTKRTATWCPFCGSWGWDFFKDLRDNVSDKAVLIAAHYGGSTLENPTSLDFVSNLGGSSQPKFFINNEIQAVTSSTTADALAVMEVKIDNNYLAAPLANVGLETTWNGVNLELATKTRFFQAAEGAYYLGIYLVEDLVIAPQASQSVNAKHMRILRAALTPTTFGDLLVDGAVASGTEFAQTYPVVYSGFDLENLDIVGIIWKKEGTKFMAVNVWAIDAKPAPPVDPVTCPGLSASIQPNLLDGPTTTLFLCLSEPGEVTINLVNDNGQTIRILFEGFLPAGELEFPIETGNIPVSGWYAVTVRTAAGQRVAIPFLKQ